MLLEAIKIDWLSAKLFLNLRLAGKIMYDDYFKEDSYFHDIGYVANMFWQFHKLSCHENREAITDELPLEFGTFVLDLYILLRYVSQA